MTITQPMPAPRTLAEYEAAKPHMIDTLGRPLVTAWCDTCRIRHFTVEPCASEAPCPTCGSTRSRCMRPSEHEAPSWHRARVARFEALCDQRESEGLPQVARWPAPAPPPDRHRPA